MNQTTKGEKEMVLSNYGETMCVGELIEKLSKLPMDIPVVGTWEGIFTP